MYSIISGSIKGDGLEHGMDPEGLTWEKDIRINN